MSKLRTLLTTLGLGAGLMYFYDSQQGARRRTMVRDRVASLRSDADDAIDLGVRDLKNRARGILAEAMGRLSDEEANDWLLVERVRAEMGRFISHPKAVEVTANQGQVTLRGPILADEVDMLIKRTAMVRGVRGVENQLEVHAEAGGHPALQGESRKLAQRPEWAQENWSPSMRLIGSLGGGLLALYGSLRRGLIGTGLTAAGLSLVARGVANVDVRTFLGMGARKDAIRISKAIHIQAPVDEIYRFWTHLENLPRFMANVKEVKDLGGGRSHWRVTGPAGTDAEWDAITTAEIPNERIAWESVAGSPVKSTGQVRFHPNPDGSTQISVQMSYTPPAGAAGHAVATLLGANPRQQMDEDLARLKTLFESGETKVDGKKMSRDSANLAADAG